MNYQKYIQTVLNDESVKAYVGEYADMSWYESTEGSLHGMYYENIPQWKKGMYGYVFESDVESFKQALKANDQYTLDHLLFIEEL